MVIARKVMETLKTYQFLTQETIGIKVMGIISIKVEDQSLKELVIIAKHQAIIVWITLKTPLIIKKSQNQFNTKKQPNKNLKKPSNSTRKTPVEQFPLNISFELKTESSLLQTKRTSSPTILQPSQQFQIRKEDIRIKEALKRSRINMPIQGI